MEFALKIERDSDQQVVIVECLRNRLDHKVSDDFKREICAVVEERGTKVVVDLSRVDFMDSTALAALICVLKRIGSSGDLVICGLGRSLRTFLHLTRMDRVFRTFPDTKSAVASLTAAA